MFTAQELTHVRDHRSFVEDFAAVRQSLVNWRLKQPVLTFSGSEARLVYFTEAVLASAPDWRRDERLDLCEIAAEISEALAANDPRASRSRRLRVRGALLYELADLPALAASILDHNDLPDFLVAFFRRTGPFAKLNGAVREQIDFDPTRLSTGELAFIDDAQSFAVGAQNDDPNDLAGLRERNVSSSASEIAKGYDLGFSATEVRAFSVLIGERTRRATIASVASPLTPTLRKMGFPIELLPAQSAAIDGGLLDHAIPSWGFAAPTGSGKTFLTRLLITDIILSSAEHKVIYLVPSRALVSEVAGALTQSLAVIGCRVLALSAQLVDLDEREATELDEASVIVMTPEKADLLLRLGADFLQSVTLAIVDEAHHIESGTRGALLELYLWRLKRLLPRTCRYVFLSAVAPNIEAIAQWLDPNGRAAIYRHRPTRMRVGIYSVQGKGKSARGVIRYEDKTSMTIASSEVQTGIRRGICQLAEFMQKAGPVLVVAKGKKECESIASELKSWLEEQGRLTSLTDAELDSDTYHALDASLEREMYADITLRTLIKHRIGYHDAGLPPSVRHGVERAIRERQIQYVFATTTLAEGVNFPFSSVIVQSLALREPPEAGRPSRYSPVTPRTFWNIAGRAGRPGFDAEGQVILFEPSLGLDKINAVLAPYLEPALASLSPVKSALASALEEIQADLRENQYTASGLEEVRLPETMSRRARGRFCQCNVRHLPS